jgi:hypothetical protein
MIEVAIRPPTPGRPRYPVSPAIHAEMVLLRRYLSLDFGE